ncbi:hypothetical protein B0J12DRAFT_747398 [Macrophomina phaseolina]|uniref:DUF7703 domain-containing protein n=1 Tax=Macrophomina phaseolina TaxID=35725 RepID=A0ABQ8FQ84_9PEZI|nr:hypothetical protein B0J12DRAFT_747398 [Macrophomina phaseolina]
MNGRSKYLKITKKRPPYGLSLVIIAFLAIAIFNSVKIIIKTTYKAFAYSVKLKLEFFVLNRLAAATRNKKTAANYDPVFTDSTRLATLQTGISGGI